jgi:hypothetical protein
MLLLLGFWTTTSLVPLFPLNNIRGLSWHERGQQLLSKALYLAFPPVAFYLHHKPWMGLSLLIYAFVLLAELYTWWWPYWAGARPQTQAAYEQQYAATASPLPAPRGRPRPNWESLVLQALLIAAGTLGALYYFQVPDSACVFCVEKIGQS